MFSTIKLAIIINSLAVFIGESEVMFFVYTANDMNFGFCKWHMTSGFSNSI